MSECSFCDFQARVADAAMTIQASLAALPIIVNAPMIRTFLIADACASREVAIKPVAVPLPPALVVAATSQASTVQVAWAENATRPVPITRPVGFCLICLFINLYFISQKTHHQYLCCYLFALSCCILNKKPINNYCQISFRSRWKLLPGFHHG